MTATAGPKRSGSAFGFPDPSTTTSEKATGGLAGRAAGPLFCAAAIGKVAAAKTTRISRFIGRIIQSRCKFLCEVRMSEPSANASVSQPPIYVGTSGWAYAIWKPEFYPKNVASKNFLKYYATQLNTVEVNYTFRRSLTEKAATGWMA